MSGGQRGLSDYDLISFLDDELGSDRRDEIEAQLTRDPSASARVDQWRRHDELLRAAFGRVAAEPLPAALLLSARSGSRADAAGAEDDDAPIRAPIRQVRRIERIRRERREKLVALTVASFAAGAVATLGVAGFTELAPSILARPASYVFPQLAAEEAGERMTHRAMEGFWTFGNDQMHPVDVTSAAQIASWLTRRVGAPVRAPNLSMLNLRLLGGRLTPGDHSPAALILYEAPAGNRIGLYIGRSPAEAKSFHYTEVRVTGAVWWMTRGASYAVVGRADKVGLFKVARFARAQEPGHAHYSTLASAPQ